MNWRRPYDAQYLDDMITTEDFTCSRCSCTVHDVIARSLAKREQLIRCWVCGTQLWVAGLPEVKPEDEVFAQGRYERMTIGEVHKLPEGPKYLDFVSRNGDPLTPQIKAFLNGLAS